MAIKNYYDQPNWSEFFAEKSFIPKGSPIKNAIAMQKGTYTPDVTWNNFYQLYPKYHPSNK